jgi:hypothetical protein
MRKHTRKFAILLIVLLGGCGSLRLFHYLGTRPTPSRQELCRDLELQISTDECLSKESITEILTEAFEPGKTTRTQINQMISQYRVEMHTSPSGVREKYILETTWFNRNMPGIFQTTYTFKYDENDLFTHFVVRE